MIYKNASKLSEDYFISYLKLTMNAQESTLSDAKDIAFERLFYADKDRYGPESYDNFLKAYNTLQRNSKLEM